ncbi:helix-turn-helix transcriptional regulator [Streptomyces sp. MST-110588]|uniref:helix-turn-helix domain-containing protein n=1 Tax=Streptomyces sp. MST-110588 TaxID=2833628 RepID=UPI001F5D390D|nr:helix-turn-helix transcriptional regulator [Streptomyces sp. MST-110588]UNO39424.1 helix-turn-helix domain-containing protein [Streptomyces sp. MST-110588]
MGGKGNGRGEASSTARDDGNPAIWAGYGRLLKLLRERAGLTQTHLAEAIGYSVEQVASVEQGRRPAKADFTRRAEEALGVSGELAVLQPEVDRAKLPLFFQDFAGIEAEAVSRCSYDPLLIPGLLQSPEYARAILAVRYPPLDDEAQEQQLEARLRRQVVLTGKLSIDFSFIVGESVLRCPVGDSGILKGQLHRMLEMQQLPNVDVQVVPTLNGAHTGLHGPLVIVETTAHRRYAYFESHGESMVISDPAKVSILGLRYGKLRTQALNADESRRLIDRIAGEL